jgi:hypothetical protein
MQRLQGHEELAREREALGPLGAQEKEEGDRPGRGMVVLWVAGSWVERLDVVMVAPVGSVAMPLQGIRLLDWSSSPGALRCGATVIRSGAALRLF